MVQWQLLASCAMRVMSSASRVILFASVSLSFMTSGGPRWWGGRVGRGRGTPRRAAFSSTSAVYHIPVCQAAAAAATSASNAGNDEGIIQVWDNVLPPEGQLTLHRAAEQSPSRLNHHMFIRGEPTSGNALETALDDILNEVDRGGSRHSNRDGQNSNTNDTDDKKRSGGGSSGTLDQATTSVDNRVDEGDDNMAQPEGIITGGGRGTNNPKKKRQYVEYWSRQEWRHIEAHADIDEILAKQQDASSAPKNEQAFRYPTHGHVLYLQVGTNVTGPTCLFPGCSSGRDLLLQQPPMTTSSPRTTELDKEGGGRDEGSGFDDPTTGTTTTVDVVTVPSVNGRLLRFDGSMLHAVPRPHDLWFLLFKKGSDQFEPAEVYGRSVILFNVWDEEETCADEKNGEDHEVVEYREDVKAGGMLVCHGGGPPLDVPMLDGVKHEGDEETEFCSSSALTDHDANDGRTNSCGRQSSNPRDLWTEVPFVAPPSPLDPTSSASSSPEEQADGPSRPPSDDRGKSQTVKVWLLGNERRRGHTYRTVKVGASAEAARDLRRALAEETAVRRTTLERRRQ